MQRKREREQIIQQELLEKGTAAQNHGNDGTLFRERVAPKMTSSALKSSSSSSSGGVGGSGVGGDDGSSDGSSSSTLKDKNSTKKDVVVEPKPKKAKFVKMTTAQKKAAAALRKAVKLERIEKERAAKASIAAKAAKADELDGAKGVMKRGGSKKRGASDLSEGGDGGGQPLKKNKVNFSSIEPTDVFAWVDYEVGDEDVVTCWVLPNWNIMVENRLGLHYNYMLCVIRSFLN